MLLDEDSWSKNDDAVLDLSLRIHVQIELVLREYHISSFVIAVRGFDKIGFACSQPIVKVQWDLEAVENLQIGSLKFFHQIINRLLFKC